MPSMYDDSGWDEESWGAAQGRPTKYNTSEKESPGSTMPDVSKIKDIGGMFGGGGASAAGAASSASAASTAGSAAGSIGSAGAAGSAVAGGSAAGGAAGAAGGLGAAGATPWGAIAMAGMTYKDEMDHTMKKFSSGKGEVKDISRMAYPTESGMFGEGPAKRNNEVMWKKSGALGMAYGGFGGQRHQL